MKNKIIYNYFAALLLALFTITGCVKDNSAYLSQNKKDVKVDDYDIDATNPEDTAGLLLPGIHRVKIKVENEGNSVDRRFAYFMPVSINKSKPISLIFNFHGSYESGVDPLQNFSLSNSLNQLAIKENCIIVFPAGEDTGDAVNWQNTEYHLPFVDAMLGYFKNHSPQIDTDRVYTSGQSSGAIFSFALAIHRSTDFAAAVPVSGQMKLSSADIPEEVIPIRAFNGVNDDIVIHSAALENITIWANQIGGYFPSDVRTSDTLMIDNYKPYIKRAWNRGKVDIELYSIIDEGHGVNWSYITPLMWEFMKSHIKNQSNSDVYLSSEVKRFDAQEGQEFSSQLRFTENAVVSILSAPNDWKVTLQNGQLQVKAPNDFFAPTTINRKGEIIIQAAKNGNIAEIILPYELQAPKMFYEVGDIVFDENFKPTGVVFWVNPENIKEAKIIALEHILKKFGAVGSDFFTPSFTDGYQNTLDLIEHNNTNGLGLDASSSAFVYAYEYQASPGQTKGWYLPAVDELKLLDPNLSLVNATLSTYGDALEITSSATSYHLSSTMVNDGSVDSPLKRFYTFDYHSNPSFHGYYILGASADNTAGFISTRPIKKVSK